MINHINNNSRVCVTTCHMCIGTRLHIQRDRTHNFSFLALSFAVSNLILLSKMSTSNSSAALSGYTSDQSVNADSPHYSRVTNQIPHSIQRTQRLHLHLLRLCPFCFRLLRPRNLRHQFNLTYKSNCTSNSTCILDTFSNPRAYFIRF